MQTTRLDQLQAFLRESPEEAFLLFALAKEYEGLQQPEKALAYYIQLRDLHPDYIGLYYHLGKLQEKQGQPELALLTYTQGEAQARAAKDQHALNELLAAKEELSEEP